MKLSVQIVQSQLLQHFATQHRLFYSELCLKVHGTDWKVRKAQKAVVEEFAQHLLHEDQLLLSAVARLSGAFGRQDIGQRQEQKLGGKLSGPPKHQMEVRGLGTPVAQMYGSHVKGYQTFERFRNTWRQTKPSGNVSNHAGTDILMAYELDPPTGVEADGLRLADVVEQSSQEEKRFSVPPVGPGRREMCDQIFGGSAHAEVALLPEVGQLPRHFQSMSEHVEMVVVVLGSLSAEIELRYEFE